MKFVFFGYDFSVSVLEHILAQGHQLCGVFTFPCDNVYSFNTEIKALSQKHNVPLSEVKPTPADIEQYLEQGVELFLSAGYMFKIPPIDERRAYAVNIHPAYLPRARGVMPTPYILIQEPEAAGVTLHKISEEFDRGDIILQAHIKLNQRETVESYSTRALMLYAPLIIEFLKDPKSYWENAKPQDETVATHYPPPDDVMRILDFNQKVEDIDKAARAFGRFGSLANIQGQLFAVYDLDYWNEEHGYPCGALIQKRRKALLVAAKDGFILLKEFVALDI